MKIKIIINCRHATREHEEEKSKKVLSSHEEEESE